MTVASSKLIKVLLHVFYFGGSLCTQSKKSLPSVVWSYLHLFQLRFDSVTYRRHTTIAYMHDIRLYAFIGDCLTAKQNIPDLHTTIGFCCETLHQFWCETFTVIAWLTTYDYWLLLRNFAPVLVWNCYGDRLTDHVWLLAFAAKL